jgi:hypothetical protein
MKWAEEGERSTRYFFELEKKQGENKMWNRIKNTEGKYKYDIDSIIDEQIAFYSKLFTRIFRNLSISFFHIPHQVLNAFVNSSLVIVLKFIVQIPLQNRITRYDLYDAWRKLNPNKKRYSFQRRNSKSRIDFIL